MSRQKHLTAPVATEKIPSGIGCILINETAERFAFYGMLFILVTFMTEHLVGPEGKSAVMGEQKATEIFHWFKAAVYAIPFLGALLSDIWLGKYKTIILFSIVYCAGYFALALDQTRLGLYLGLGLIAVGSGVIKPCVSANVGDQFGRTNQHLITKVYAWFYWCINLGAFISPLLTPILLGKYGPKVAFGFPGVMMLLATIAFWAGKRKYVHMPAGGLGFVKETFSGEGISALIRLSIILLPIAVFFALFDQTGSAWILQAKKMDLYWLGVNWRKEQLTAVNALFIMILIPVFSYGVYPMVNRVFRLTPLRKMSIGMFLMVAAFTIPSLVETSIVAGAQPSIGWQILAYLLLTAAEVMVSITYLEFSYTQAPKKMKSFIMCFYLLAISLGNAVAAVVNMVIQNPDGTSKLEGASYYWFFTALMVGASVVFIFVAAAYKERTYIQDEVGV